jgi:hypothetical protein
MNIASDLTAPGRLPRKGEIYGLDFFLPNSVSDGHLLDVYALLHQTVGYVVYLGFKIQTALFSTFIGFWVLGFKYEVPHAASHKLKIVSFLCLLLWPYF